VYIPVFAGAKTGARDLAAADNGQSPGRDSYIAGIASAACAAHNAATEDLQTVCGNPHAAPALGPVSNRGDLGSLID
jgi:hypothetical protein